MTLLVSKSDCHKQLGELFEIRDAAARAVEIDSLNVKALMFVGEANVEVGKNDETSTEGVGLGVQYLS